MKAVVYTKYGAADVLHLETVNKPDPKDNEILIKIMATSVSSGDVRLRKADPFGVRFVFGLFKPKINVLGGVYSGRVEAIGKAVTRFKIGDEVFGSTDFRFGAYAEFLCISADGAIAIKPGNLSHTEAAAIPFGGATALYFIKKAGIHAGQKVLINGASGAVGTAAVQLAKYYGAHVTGVCSTSSISVVKSIGADNTIDYTKVDFTKNAEKYDVIFDTVNKLSVSASVSSLNQNGTLILGSAGLPQMLQGLWQSVKGTKVLGGVIKQTSDDIDFLSELAEIGKMRPVIDRTYSLDQIVDAHRYVEKGHKKGTVAIDVK